MNAAIGPLQTPEIRHVVSRRATLRGLGAGIALALTVGVPAWTGATSEDRTARSLVEALASEDLAELIDAYVAAVNAGDLGEILSIYNDDAFHIMLPSADGSAGVCVGKEQFRMWYEQSMANGDGVEVADGTLALDGNQATFVARLTSEPWRKMGIEALEATSEIVVIDGRIMTHVVALTPDSVRLLQSAQGKTSVLAPIVGEAWGSTRQFPGRPY